MTASTESKTISESRKAKQAGARVPVKKDETSTSPTAMMTNFEKMMGDMFKTWSTLGSLTPFTDGNGQAALKPESLEAWKAQADRYFDELNRNWGGVARMNPFDMYRIPNGFMFKLKVDIKDDEDGYQVTAELPGLEKEDINLNIDGNELTISGKKNAESEGQGCVRERRFGSFLRSFTLPDTVDTANVEARFHNGLLTVHLPKSEKSAATGKAIPIQGDS